MTLTMEREQNCVEWDVGGVVHSEQYPDGPSEHTPIFPAAERWIPQPTRLLSSLREASLTASSDSTRYALHCLLLRGKSGDLVATDSRQLLIQKGFDWPWIEELMMPASRGFRSAPLRQAVELYGAEVGRSDQHVVFRFGPWSLAFPIVTEGRFPSIDSIVPPAQQSLTTLELDETDREWLAERLPRSSPSNKQIATIELNGAVAVRCAERDQLPEQEWIMSRSRRRGPETCVETDAGFLSRLHDLGLSRIEMGDEKTPFVARDSQQTYLWMGRSGKPTPRPKSITQLASPTRVSARSPVPVPTPKENHMTKSSTANKDDASEIDQLIDQATVIKGRLKDLQTELQDLITALR